MKTFNQVINEAALDPKKLTFIPCQSTKGEIKFCTAVGGVFNIKKEKYANQLEQNLKEIGIFINTGFESAIKVIKQASTKLIYILYNEDNVTKANVCNADILKPLDGSKLK